MNHNAKISSAQDSISRFSGNIINGNMLQMEKEISLPATDYGGSQSTNSETFFLEETGHLRRGRASFFFLSFLVPFSDWQVSATSSFLFTSRPLPCESYRHFVSSSEYLSLLLCIETITWIFNLPFLLFLLLLLLSQQQLDMLDSLCSLYTANT